MSFQNVVLKGVLLKRFALINKNSSWIRGISSCNSSASTTTATTAVAVEKDQKIPNTEKDDLLSDIDILRTRIAPWITIGQYNSHLLSHLSLVEILRALSVLHICSYDFLVERSVKLFQLSQKFGTLGRWLLRSTFFKQFVGGENEVELRQVVSSLQNRRITLMLVSVLEEDVEDEPEESNTYDNNLTTLFGLVDLMSSMEKHKPILQLKPSTIMPAKTMENIATSILNYCSISDESKLTNLIEQVANAIASPNNLELRANKLDIKEYLDGLCRADLLAQHAKKRGVHILVDAEFYSCKPSISMLAQALMARHNQKNHWIGNTIQCYLKEASPTITTELNALTKNLGVNWYGKVVRGAYIDRERILAAKKGAPSPTCDSYECTSASYNKVIQIILNHLADEIKHGKKCSTSHLVVASHNEKSIRLTANTMKELGIGPDSNLVSFAQIYGMADYLSTPLVNEKYRVYKSTPYGPMGKVFPYLSRRASENRSVIKGAREEISMLRRELKRRLLSPI